MNEPHRVGEAKNVSMHGVVFLDEVGSKGERQGQDFNHVLAIRGIGRRCDDLRVRDGIRPVRARVREVRSERLLSRAIGYVRGEASRLTQEQRSRFFHEFATRETVQRFAWLARPPWQESPALLASAYDDLSTRRDRDEVKP